MHANQKNSKTKSGKNAFISGGIENFDYPNNRESEGDFLLGLIQIPGVIGSIKSNNYTKCIFYREVGVKIYSLILLMYDTDSLSLNNLTISLQATSSLNEAVKEYPDLFTNQKFINLSQLKFTYSSLFQLYYQRVALESTYKSFEAIKEGNIVGVIENINKTIETLKDSNTEIEDYGIENSIAKSLAEIERIKEGGLDCPTSGLNLLNDLLPYWFNTDIILIAGRPGMGKTIAGVKHSIEAAVQNYPVGFVALEMPASSIINRIISCYSDIPYSRIKKGEIRDYEQQRFDKSIASIKELPIFFYDSHKRDFEDISNWARLMVKDKGVKMLVVDYMQLVKDKTVGPSEYEQVTSVSVKFKQLQTELKVPIILLAQLNRAAENTTHKRPSLKDLRSSGQIEQDASVIILLFREDYYLQEEAYQNKTQYTPNNTIEYIIGKNRDGGTGSVILGCKAAYNQIYDT